MSGAETARCRVVQRRIGGAETAAPKCPSPKRMMSCLSSIIRKSPIFFLITNVNKEKTHYLSTVMNKSSIFYQNLSYLITYIGRKVGSFIFFSNYFKEESLISLESFYTVWKYLRSTANTSPCREFLSENLLRKHAKAPRFFLKQVY